MFEREWKPKTPCCVTCCPYNNKRWCMKASGENYDEIVECETIEERENFEKIFRGLASGEYKLVKVKD